MKPELLLESLRLDDVQKLGDSTLGITKRDTDPRNFFTHRRSFSRFETFDDKRGYTNPGLVAPVEKKLDYDFVLFG